MKLLFPPTLLLTHPIGSIPVLCRNYTLSWTASCLLQPVSDICRHWERALADVVPPAPMKTLPGTISVSFLLMRMCLLPSAWHEQSWMSAGTLSWVFLFTPPRAVQTKTSGLGCWFSHRFPSRIAACPWSLFLSQSPDPLHSFKPPFLAVLLILIQMTLFSTCWPVSALDLRRPQPSAAWNGSLVPGQRLRLDWSGESTRS